MKVYEFGEQGKPVLMLLPGTGCYWRSNFGKVIEPLAETFRVACVSYDGFDETEQTQFPTMIEETAKIEEYIKEHYDGKICAVYGSTPGREVIELKDDEDPLRQLCLHVMQHSECARYIADEKVQQRRDTADRLAREFKADGIIYEQMKYCDYWGFERALVSYIMHEEYNWPVLSIDRLYNNGNSGQLRTRVQAFVESLEIKRIQKNGGTK